MSVLTIPVQLKTPPSAGLTPTSLVQGEFALDHYLGRLWWADNNGVKQFASLPAIATAAQQTDLTRVLQNLLYTALLVAALRGVPDGLVDGVVDPFSTTADVNTSKSSGYTFSSSAGTIASGSKDANTTLLMHFDASPFTDDAGHAVSTVGSPALSTSSPPYGAGALSLNGSSGLSLAASTDFNFTKAGTWTIEFTFNVTSASAQQTLFSQNALNLYVKNGAIYLDNNQVTNISGGSVAASTKYTLAVVNNAGAITLYLNGTSIATGTLQGDSTGSATSIGYNSPNANAYVTGIIDELRISQGVARYTANYTVATAPFAITTPAAMVLQSATLASAVASPSAGRVLVQVDPSSAAFTPNTDLLAYFSRDGGTTFTQGTLSAVGTMPDGTTIYDTGYFSVSGQPAGNSTMTYQITTPTKKAIVLTGVSMQVKP